LSRISQSRFQGQPTSKRTHESLIKEKGKQDTYKTTDGHPVRMRLATGCALHFEGVVEGFFGVVFGTEVGDSSQNRSAVLVRFGGRERLVAAESADPSSSAVRYSASMVVVLCSRLE